MNEYNQPELRITTLIDDDNDHYVYNERLNIGQKYSMELQYEKLNDGTYFMGIWRDGIRIAHQENTVHQTFSNVKVTLGMNHQPTPAIIENLKIGEL